MEEIFLRFPHLGEQILEKLDNQSLTNCRMVQISWNNFFNQKNYPEIRIMKHIKDFHNEDKNWTVFHEACTKKQVKIAEVIMKKSVELEINLNAVADDGAGFHFPCMFNDKNMAKLIMEKSVEFNIDLNVENSDGRTGFNLACHFGHTNLARFLIRNSARFNINLNY